MAARDVRDNVRELFARELPERGTLAQRVAGALIGGLVGAPIGFALFLLLFGWLGGDGQDGVGALWIGVPAGFWIGALVGMREATR
jgi:hypothetical protein